MGLQPKINGTTIYNVPQIAANALKSAICYTSLSSEKYNSFKYHHPFSFMNIDIEIFHAYVVLAAYVPYNIMWKFKRLQPYYFKPFILL